MEAVDRNAAVQAMINKAMGDLPPLPTVVAKVLQLTNDANATTTDLEKYVSMDQAMSTKMLRVVNSPYFGLSGQISSVNHAIVILGFNQMRNLVLSVGASSVFSSDSPKTQPVQVALWRHALATATGAQIIAKSRKLPLKDAELAFVGGLLSNVGALFLLRHLTMPYIQVFEAFLSEKCNLADRERALFGMSHAEVGMQLTKQWKLPEDLILLIGRHEDALAGEVIPVLAAVHLADRIAHEIVNGESVKGEIGFADPAALKWLDASAEEIEAIKGETKIRLENSAELLGALS